MNINISQVDSRILVEVDGKALPDIFSGYTLKSSGSGEPELWLGIKKDATENGTSTNLAVSMR